jgi:hypothetical protein
MVLPAPEDEFVARSQEVALDLCPELCIAKTYLISRGGSV